MATTHDNDVDDDSTKLSQANPLLEQVLVTRPTMSSDVTADNRPEQPLMFQAARDRFDGNTSNVVVTNVQNATLVAAKPVCLAGPPRASADAGADHFPGPSTSPPFSPPLPFPSSLPSPRPLPSHFPFFPSLPSHPLEVGPLNPAREFGGAL